MRFRVLINGVYVGGEFATRKEADQCVRLQEECALRWGEATGPMLVQTFDAETGEWLPLTDVPRT